MPEQEVQLEHSEEVQEILGHVPHWLMRWGIALLFFILTLLMAGSYFFKYPVVIPAPLIITTVNSPAPLTVKKNGRIKRWFATDGQDIARNERIALIASEANYEDIQGLANWLEHNANATENLSQIMLAGLELGTVQRAYEEWVKSAVAFIEYERNNSFENSEQLLKKRLETKTAFYQQMLIHRKLKTQEFALAQDEFNRDSTFFKAGDYGISRSDYQTSVKKLLTKKSENLIYKASFYDHELAIFELRQALIDLEKTHSKEMNRLKSEVEGYRNLLLSKIEEWKRMHLIASPISGKLTLTKYWSENQVLNSGSILATVVPQERTDIICRAMVNSSGIGKIRVGQKVNIKLSGFPHLEYGILEGQVKTVSLVPEDQGYIVGIELSHGMTSTYKERLKFIQEMDGTAEIITESKRLIYKLLSR